MLKPPHPVARLAYEMALQINPNNHALDGGRASSAMEKEAVAALARMVGWETHLGHLCSGGTMANLEAQVAQVRFPADHARERCDGFLLHRGTGPTAVERVVVGIDLQGHFVGEARDGVWRFE